MKVSLGGTSALLAVLVYWSSSSSRESRIDAREHEPIIPADGRSTALQSATFFFERTTSSSPRFKFDSRRYLLTEEEEQDIEKRAEDAEIADDLSIFVGFDVIYKMVIFVAATWLAGYISTLLGMPSLVGEITAGFLLGPPLADFVPYPAAVVLIGKFGLLGLIVESGIGIDVAQLKETGLRAVAMAFVGTALPLTAGLGLGRAAGLDFRSAMAIGACFAPSSFSVVANVLCKGEVLNTPVGQLIVASSVVDDVLGLILLSILEVFVNEDPKAIDFVIPFISSFGYLLVLGYLGLTWIPHTIEHKIMPLFAERHREFVAFGMMFLLLIIYLPLLDYSGASYLTGAFLAGLSFSQIHSVHASFMRNGRQILTWLLRMFFAATIGFQIPVTYFQDLYVLRWGGKFLACIVAKGLLGLAVPRGEHKLPEDFPYDPYWRDVTITSLAIMCRGEFNFIIASFALGEGLFGPDLYSAVVFAILVSAIVGPLLLSNVIQFYNEKSKAYLASSHPIKRDGNTCDGLRPLFLAIQTRTPIHWGLQETFKKALEKAGLIIIDHRSVHTLGLNAVDITELFVQDTKVKIKVPHCFGPTDDSEWAEQSSPQTVVLDEATTTKDAPGTSDDFSVENGVSAAQEIQERCDEINHDNPDDYAIQVAQWEAHIFESNASATGDAPPTFSPQFYSLNVSLSYDEGSQFATSEVNGADSFSETIQDSIPQEEDTTIGNHHHEAHHLSILDLWEADRITHNVAREGAIGHFHIGSGTEEEGETSQYRCRAESLDANQQYEATAIRERLHGYVRPTHRRTNSEQVRTGDGPPHRRTNSEQVRTGDGRPILPS